MPVAISNEVKRNYLMTRIFLQHLVENLPADALPPNWADLDLHRFSRDKNLYEYQQVALRNALRGLWKYYQSPDDPTFLNASFMNWYKEFGLEEDLDIPLDRSSFAKRNLASLLASYFTVNERDSLDYTQFINRMSFWMATGSGKTLVIVKLIELLHALIQRGEIPSREILVLAHRDDLLEQLRQHVNDFNANGTFFIRLVELRDYADVKFNPPSLLPGAEVTVFFYRSDNLSDEKKEKIIDFRSYDNNGQWYVLLDEAHKGDKEDSKRQHIYSILSRNGFLFNFSATFTDARDIVTTVANYNLSEFIRKGHGKHITVLKQEIRAFRPHDDYSDVEKQKIVLKALIMLTYVRQFEKRVRGVRSDLYHRPLMMTLVNSVNTEEADLKLFFRELVRIGLGQIDAGTWESARKEILDELRGNPKYLFETDNPVVVQESIFQKLTQADLLEAVFNSRESGEIEVLVRPSDRQEVAFKLKTSDDPFALVRIGDISDWLRRELNGYEVNQHFKDESYFVTLNKPDSDINILMGSRSFYEGWDSNRPNVITYINIGTDVEAKKFILQSVGRGVRIEPFRNQRKRLAELSASGVLSPEDQAIAGKIRNSILPLESLYVFGTNREALNQVVSELDQESKQTGEHEIALDINHDDVNGKLLLIPVYQWSDSPLYKERKLARFTLNQENLDLLRDYLGYIEDDRVFFALHESTPEQIQALRAHMDQSSEAFLNNEARSYHNLNVLVRNSLNFFSLHPKRFSGFKTLENEINHFQHIRVAVEALGDLERRIEKASKKPLDVQELREKLNKQQISFDEYDERIRASAGDNGEAYIWGNTTLSIKRISNHYYIPVILSDTERVEYIRNIIHFESERKFLKHLDDYLNDAQNLFKTFDWWLFSRVDESMDEITIPYYYPIENRIANFKPDFIFWLKKGEQYHIVFVDPKGTGRSEYQLKVDGFKHLFEENDQPKVFEYQGLRVKVSLFLFTEDAQVPAEGYRNYWIDNIGRVLEFINN